MSWGYTVPAVEMGDYVVELRVNIPAHTIVEAEQKVPDILAQISSRYNVERGKVLRVCKCCNRSYGEHGG